jgi:hypothetical protein
MEDRAFQVGDKVLHPEFGDGLILDVRGAGDSASALVSFSDKSQRRLMLKFAKLNLREPAAAPVPGAEPAAKKGAKKARRRAESA